MKRTTILLAVLLAGTAITTPASAVEFTLSQNNGSGPFGEITGFFNNAAHTSYTLHVDMFDNNILNTGSHWPLTISLNTGSITATALTFAGLGGPGSPYTAQPHIVAGSGGGGGGNYSNSPFSFFSDAVNGACGNGSSSGGCGQDMWLTVSGVDPNAVGGLFNTATNKFNGVDVWAAVDIFNSPNGPTFAVGLGSVPTIGEFCATPPCTVGVPGPIVGAGLPGLLTACFGLLALVKRRRNRRMDGLSA